MQQIILFAPLVGAIIAGFGHRVIGDKAAQWVTTGLLSKGKTSRTSSNSEPWLLCTVMAYTVSWGGSRAGAR